MDNLINITLISDTHTKHDLTSYDCQGGDIIIHSGDFMNSGYNVDDISRFLVWFASLQYTHKIFIPGNHDRAFELFPSIVNDTLKLAKYKSITCLNDASKTLKIKGQSIKIYGTPWQPEFFNWAFNLPANSQELFEKWQLIPEDTDILVTHGPAHGILDKVENKPGNLGCNLLLNRIHEVKPKIHTCGHIHSGRGHMFDGDTHFYNASVLNEAYCYMYNPINIKWNPITNEVK